jgi:hypothetical protein
MELVTNTGIVSHITSTIFHQPTGAERLGIDVNNLDNMGVGSVVSAVDETIFTHGGGLPNSNFAFTKCTEFRGHDHYKPKIGFKKYWCIGPQFKKQKKLSGANFPKSPSIYNVPFYPTHVFLFFFNFCFYFLFIFYL